MQLTVEYLIKSVS